MSKLDELTFKFLKDRSENNAVNLLRYVRQNNNFNLSMIIGEFLSKEYKNSYYILQEYAICAYYANDFIKSYDINNQILEFKGLTEEQALSNIFNQHFSLKNITNRYIYYNIDKVNEIMRRKKKEFPLITFTMTTCKRFDLFEKTMNSILNCFEDIDMIDYFLCVDDNSSEEDREKMKKLYPFLTFYFKTSEEKGHIKSMNIIRDYVLETTQTPYFIHLEDDWKFFCKKNYIKDALEVLNENINIGQCLFNKNYIEIEEDIMNVKGGDYNITKTGIRYYIHEFSNTEEKKIEWIKKHGNASSSCYWPHFSLRPSVLRTKVLKDIGEFNIEAPHFERDYAYRYVNQGYISVFFENIYCIHTGRLTSQINDKSVLNAYILNNENQFYEEKTKDESKDETKDESKDETKDESKELKIKTYILNLDRRPDRWDKFLINSSELKFLQFERFNAVDGYKVISTTQLQRIFNNNDYNMKVGMVGCLMSHIKMCIELINSEYDIYCILEDDIEITTNFENKFLNIIKQLKNTNWDLVYLGHHLRNLNDKEYSYNKQIQPVIEQTNVYNSFQISLGGTIGYLITKSGAIKLLDFISENGSTNCIDTLQQKSANILNIYYCNPHLIYSECFRDENNIDTDIQNNNKSLTLPFETKVQDELNFYKNNNLIIERVDFENIINVLLKEPTEEFFIYTIDNDKNICEIKKMCKKNSLKYYTIEEKAIFIICSKKNIERYCHSFKIKGEYSIEDCSLE